MTIGFSLDGEEFTALNGGAVFSFTPAVSFVVNCDSQEELDRLWEKLSEGGEPGRCGWLKDRFGLSWQIIPSVLPQLIGGNDADKSKRAMTAMLQMSKIDIARLKQAAEQG